MTVTNAGTQDALAVDGNEAVVRLDLPTLGMSNQIVTASQGFGCVLSNADAVATCTGDLLAGQSTTITAKLTVGAATPDKITVTVTADPLNAIPETDETNNSEVETTTVILDLCTACVDIALGQIVAAPNPVPNGDDVTYEFTATNIGDTPAIPGPGQKLVVLADLDGTANESSLLSTSATNGFTCSTNPDFLLDPSQPEVRCESEDGLAPGAGTAITVVAHVSTAGTPSFVDFDVSTDTSLSVGDTRRFNNDGGLRVDVIAP